MKNKRQQAIAEIIKNNQISKQEELVDLLNEQGFCVTQATVSRDIKQMNLRKSSKKGQKSHYVLEEQVEPSFEKRGGAYESLLKESVIKVDTAMNLLVIKTQPGMAMAVAAAVDSFQYDEIVGTIAGDDTVMVAIRTIEDALTVQKRILQKTQGDE